MKVNVYINQSERRFLTGGYQPGDPMELALTFEAEAESALNLCDQVFAALNCDTPTPVGTLDVARITAYHRVWPSLSVGDIIEVDGQHYACQDVGWLPMGNPEKTGPKFPMGQVVATPGALSLGVDTNALLARHASGDWGDLDRLQPAASPPALVRGDKAGILGRL